MNTTKRKKLDTKLTTNESNLICDLYNGRPFTLDILNWRDSLFCYYEISELKNKWKVNPKNLAKKLGALSSLETLGLLTEIQKYWKDDDSFYKSFNKTSPTDKINQILSDPNRNIPLEWQCSEPIEDFYRICQESDMDYMIYTQDPTGTYKEVWGIAREDLQNHLSLLSAQLLFSNVQKLSDAILNSFKA